MLMLPPSTRYCPYCNQATAQTDLVCIECGHSMPLPEASQPERRHFQPVMLQVEPKGLWIDAFATALTTLGVLLIGYSAIRIATRPLVFLAPIQTVYNAELDDVEAIPITSISPVPGQNVAPLLAPTSSSIAFHLDISRPSPDLPDFTSVNFTSVNFTSVNKGEPQSNGLVFSFLPTPVTTPMPWFPHRKRYASLLDR